METFAIVFNVDVLLYIIIIIIIIIIIFKPSVLNSRGWKWAETRLSGAITLCQHRKYLVPAIKHHHHSPVTDYHQTITTWLCEYERQQNAAEVQFY